MRITSRAIIISSFVGITNTLIFESSAEINALWPLAARFLASSILIPNASYNLLQIAFLVSEEFSPIPAVKIIASAPPIYP